MEYFYGGGGRSNPDFTYRFLVKNVPDVMWAWCESYPLTGPFERWYVQHNFKSIDSNGGQVQLPLIQFESRKAAYMFSIAYSEYIIKNMSYSFAKDINDAY